MPKQYLITLQPLEPYFFGNERTLNFPHAEMKMDSEEKVKTEYYVESENIPSQTTILGMLRYMALKEAKCLNPNYPIAAKKKQEELKARQKELIGEYSFSFNNEIGYGKILNIGNLFLVMEDENGDNPDCYLPCPFNQKREENKEEKKELDYLPLKMSDKLKDKSMALFVPIKYNAKVGLASSDYIKYDRKQNKLVVISEDNIYKSHEQVGISTQLDEEAFYKRKYKMFNCRNMKFAFLVKADERDGHCLFGGTEKSEIVMMGAKQSTFSFTCEEVKKGNPIVENYNELLKQMGKVQKKSTDLSVYYALSPVVFQKVPKCEFYITENKTFQFKQAYYQKGASFKTDMSYIVKPGSIFYVSDKQVEEFEKSYENAACQIIGLNKIIKLEEKING